MKITRIVALAIITATLGLTTDQSGLQAQTLRSAGPPAEFPPASYQAKQYVDSRGCIYIRAGIDGNVNWVPRVTRSRKQICGYKPTVVAGSTTRPVGDRVPEQITLSQDQTSPVADVIKPVPTPTTRVSPATTTGAATAPTIVTTAKPRRTPQVTTARVRPTPPTHKVAAVTIPAAPRVVPSPQALLGSYTLVSANTAQSGCPGLSEISQRYSNQNGARCGAQTEAPAGYRSGLRASRGAGGSQVLTPNSRVVPAHVYQQRRLSQGLTPPPGYRVAWDDDRLNMRRAERDLSPSLITTQLQVPPGYVVVEREDGRMNARRGATTTAGDAQMAVIWQEGVPRKLVDQPVERRVVTLRNSRHSSFEGEVKGPFALRLSSRSEPGAALAEVKSAPQRYVRAATFADADQARQAARALAAKGLPVRLGTVSRQGTPYKVVLAGPFSDGNSAKSALRRVRAVGYQGARISK